MSRSRARRRVITRGAKFRLSQEFKNEAFATKSYRLRVRSQIPTGRLDAAKTLLAHHADKLDRTRLRSADQKLRDAGPLIPGFDNKPDFKIDGRDFPAFHPDPHHRLLRVRHLVEPARADRVRRRDGRRGARPGGARR